MKKKTAVKVTEGHFYTIASPNGRVLEVANYNPESGAAIQLWDNTGAQWQQWRFERVEEDVYRLCNRFTGKAIDLCLGGTADGTWLHQWDVCDEKSQLWRMEEGDDGSVRFRSVHAGKYLDLYQAFSGNGGRAQIWSDNEGENQRWILTDVTEEDALPKVRRTRKSTAAAAADKTEVPKTARRRTAKPSASRKKTASLEETQA